MRVARHGDEDAQHSVTYYAMVDKFAPRLAWLSMKPMTGRTHQLRAHAEAIGCPIVGDPKYGHGDEDPPPQRPATAIPDGVERKLHLLARRLILPHPKGGVLDVTAPLPPHMRKSWRCSASTSRSATRSWTRRKSEAASRLQICDDKVCSRVFDLFERKFALTRFNKPHVRHFVL